MLMYYKTKDGKWKPFIIFKLTKSDKQSTPAQITIKKSWFSYIFMI